MIEPEVIEVFDYEDILNELIAKGIDQNLIEEWRIKQISRYNASEGCIICLRLWDEDTVDLAVLELLNDPDEDVYIRVW